MNPQGTPKFRNDDGVRTIRVGVKELECMGAAPPHDHPHVFLDMGTDDEILCPYCSTLYTYGADLGADGSDPPGAFYHPANQPAS